MTDHKKPKDIISKNILIVDDEEIMRDMLFYSLSELGHHVSRVGSGNEALEKICNEPYDLVLSDIKMPDISGLDVLDDIKKNKPDLKVILMTGYSMHNSGQFYLDKGAFGFLLKPFNLDQIRDLVKKAFDSSGKS